MLCSRCNKNPAVVFINRMENGKTVNEGYCLKCARELNIGPLDDMIKKMGISPEEMDQMQEQFDSMLEMMENGEMPEEFQDMGIGGMFPFPMPGGDNSQGAEEKGKKGEKTDKKAQKKKRLIDTFGTNLNKKAASGEIDRVIGRDKELTRVIQILNRRSKNNPALIGEPGVGKTAVAEALALRIFEKKVPAKLLEKQVYLVDFTALIAGTQFRGQFEQRVKTIIEEVKKDGNIILVIDEVHNIVSGSNNDGAMSAANIMKPALARGDIQVIGATTLAEYRKYIEKDAALERRFQPVLIEEPSVDETIEILKGIKEYYEKHHGIILTDDIIKQAVVLSKRFIHGRFLPDKAIDVIDEAGSAANLDNEILTQITILEKQLKEVKAEKEAEESSTDNEQNYEKLAELKSRECALENQLEALRPQCKPTVLEADDIARVIEMWTNVPVKKLTQSETDKLADLNEALKKKIIGQDAAADSVSKAIMRKRAGVEGRLRPASFIFVGPTGVGKTEFVKVLAEELFGSNEDFIRLDMTEYQEQHSVSKMIGSPPGYVGYDEAGQLTEKVRRRPYSVVLFDEIEKAHPSVYNILLQILDEGRLTDSQGRVVSFENTVIILTSNAGIGFGTDSLGFVSSKETLDDVANHKLKQIFKPELLNRIDEIIIFNKLKKEDFVKICRIITGEIEDALLEKGITLVVTDKAHECLADKGYSEKYGARELRRTVQKEIANVIAEMVVTGKASFGSVISIDAVDNKIVVK